MDRNAFARCQRFLNYHPAAKWFSIFSSVATAVLYVGLLTTLGFFIDLMVGKGQIPSYHDLASADQRYFRNEIIQSHDAGARLTRIQQAREEMQALGIDPGLLELWAKSDAREPSARDLALLWWTDLPPWLDSNVGEAAGNKVRAALKESIEDPERGLDATLFQPVDDSGLLGLVVRSRYSIFDRSLGFLAQLKAWTWAHGNTGYLVGLFLAALLLAILRLLLKFLANYLAAVAVLEAITRLRRSIYHHTNRLSALAFQSARTSEVVNVSTRHLEEVHEGLYQWLTVYFREPVKIGLLIAFALILNPLLAIAFLLFTLLVWLLGGQIAASFRQEGYDAEMRSLNQITLMEESLLMMRLVKVYLMEAFNQARIERQLSGYSRAQLLRYRAEALYRPLFFFLGVVAALILLLVAGYVILLGGLGVTTTLVIAAAILSLPSPMIRFLKARRHVMRSQQSAGIVFAFLDRQGGVGQVVEASFLPPLAKLLHFDSVTLREAGSERKLLQNVSINIRAGQRVAIVGPDEIEKQALIYLLPRFLDPTSGEIRIDGKDLRWVTLESLRAQIGLVLQSDLVFNDTVFNNIGCGDLTYNLQRVTDAAKLAHAHQFIQKLPHGYETPIGDMGNSLTLGEKFRVALARAILRDPAILIIEEPLVPFDDDTKAMIEDTFQRVLSGRTVIFLAHRLSTIRMCDQVLLVHQGQIEAAGEHRDLLANSELYRHLQYLEFNEFTGMSNAPETRITESPVLGSAKP